MIDTKSYLVNWSEDKHTETSDIAILHGLAPFIGLRVEAIITPKPLHQFLHINTKLGGIHCGKLFQRESPSMKT